MIKKAPNSEAKSFVDTRRGVCSYNCTWNAPDRKYQSQLVVDSLLPCIGEGRRDRRKDYHDRARSHGKMRRDPVDENKDWDDEKPSAHSNHG